MTDVVRDRGFWEVRHRRLGVHPNRLPLHIRNVLVQPLRESLIPLCMETVLHTILESGLPGWSSSTWVVDALERLEEAEVAGSYDHAIFDIYGAAVR